MILVDTSVWIDLFRDRSGAARKTLRRAVRGHEVVLTRFHQLELLQGAADEKEWDLLSDYLGNQVYLEMNDDSWAGAASLFFDLRRRGRTVRSTIDCCIAVLAMEHDVVLLHRDRDFEVIAALRPLNHRWLEWNA